jgi:thiosulfate reductase/polysulfide reductase chain A
MINSRVAGKMGLDDGDRVTIESPSGSIQVQVKLTEGIRPDCLGLAHGFGSTIGRVATAGEGVASNILVPDSGSTLQWQDVVGGESHVSTRVSIVK